MKKMIVLAAMLLLGLSSINSTNAQVNVQINIGNQPAWGPTGYDLAQYYYFPDFNFYYYINQARYIIFRNNNWVFTRSAPTNFDPYDAYKVVVNRSKPYLYNKTHIKEYAQFKGRGGSQAMIRDSKDNKYYESRQHPNHNEWNQNARNTNAATQSNGTNRTNNRSQNGRRENTEVSNSNRNSSNNGRVESNPRNNSKGNSR